jgi:hypothetical protein
MLAILLALLMQSSPHVQKEQVCGYAIDGNSFSHFINNMTGPEIYYDWNYIWFVGLNCHVVELSYCDTSLTITNPLSCDFSCAEALYYGHMYWYPEFCVEADCTGLTPEYEYINPEPLPVIHVNNYCFEFYARLYDVDDWQDNILDLKDYAIYQNSFGD